MKRANLSAAVQRTLVRLPPPHTSHYGVVPAAPPDTGLILTSIAARHRAAEEALAKVDAYARSLHDPLVVSRILARQEAVSSSAIEGANSTLDEVLAGEETEDEEARAEVRQVRKYATTVSRFIKQAHRKGNDVFSSNLVRRLHKGASAPVSGDHHSPPGQIPEGHLSGGGDGGRPAGGHPGVGRADRLQPEPDLRGDGGPYGPQSSFWRGSDSSGSVNQPLSASCSTCRPKKGSSFIRSFVINPSSPVDGDWRLELEHQAGVTREALRCSLGVAETA